MASGIYMIKNKKTGQMYIGQSKHIKRRWVDHKYERGLVRGCARGAPHRLPPHLTETGGEDIRFDVTQ